MAILSAGTNGANGESVSVTQYPGSIEDDESARVSFAADVGTVDSGKKLSVEVRVFLFVGQEQVVISGDSVEGNPAASLSSGGPNDSETIKQGDTVQGTLSVSFDEVENGDSRVDDFIVLAGFDYYGDSGYGTDSGFPDYRATSAVNSITINTATLESEVVQITDDDLFAGDERGESAQSRFRGAFANRGNFRIVEIQFENDARPRDLFPDSAREVINGIETYKIDNLEYPNPSISIDSGGRFVKHEIIGGPVVRQKVGEEPLQFGIDGICTEQTAKQIDALRNARFGKLMTERVPGGAIPVQFASASTDPIADGGGAKPAYGPGDTSELLYSYSINGVEIHRNIEEQ